MKKKLVAFAVAFLLICSTIPDILATSYPFSDVSDDSWYSEAVDYVYSHGLMNGTGNGKFEPHANMSRAMVVTVLYRMAGEPETNGINPFADVSNNTWYTKPVQWANEEGITKGTSATSFSPNENVSREQLVTFFYRYAMDCGIDVSANSDITNFTDYNRIAMYARVPFSWSVSIGLIKGVSSSELDPVGYATRAHCAAILQRFNETFIPDVLSPSMTLINEINGYYWYLDGCDYGYLHPTIEEWYDHECLFWESENLALTDDALICYEDFDYQEYQDANTNASSNIHNTLMANPVEYSDHLIDVYNMRVVDDKLYMTVGDNTYSFTRFDERKEIAVEIEILQTDVFMKTEESLDLAFKVTPAFAASGFNVTRSNLVVASCIPDADAPNKGILHLEAIEPGDTVITLSTCDGSTFVNINVHVEKTIHHVNGVTLDNHSLSMLRGETATLIPTVTPSNADNKNVTWTSSDESVAKVSQSGVVTAVGKGTATITVVTEDGVFCDSCTISVENPPLKANCSISWYFYMSDYIETGIQATVNALGGTGSYAYYHIDLYYGNLLLASTTDVTSNTVKTTYVANGQYTAVFTVRDSDGNEYSGRSTYIYSNA